MSNEQSEQTNMRRVIRSSRKARCSKVIRVLKLYRGPITRRAAASLIVPVGIGVYFANHQQQKIQRLEIQLDKEIKERHRLTNGMDELKVFWNECEDERLKLTLRAQHDSEERKEEIVRLPDVLRKSDKIYSEKPWNGIHWSALEPNNHDWGFTNVCWPFHSAGTTDDTTGMNIYCFAKLSTVLRNR